MTKRSGPRASNGEKEADRSGLPVWTCDTGPLVDQVKGDLLERPVFGDRTKYRICLPVVVVGEAVKVILTNPRFPNQARQEAYQSLMQLVASVDEIVSIPADSVRAHISEVQSFFEESEEHDREVNYMDRLILAWVIGMKARVFIATDPHFVKNADKIEKRFGVKVIDPYPSRQQRNHYRA